MSFLWMHVLSETKKIYFCVFSTLPRLSLKLDLASSGLKRHHRHGDPAALRA